MGRHCNNASLKILHFQFVKVAKTFSCCSCHLPFNFFMITMSYLVKNSVFIRIFATWWIIFVTSFKRSGYRNQLKKYQPMLLPQLATNVKIRNKVSFLGLMESDHVPTNPYLYPYVPPKSISYFVIQSCQKENRNSSILFPFFVLLLRISFDCYCIVGILCIIAQLKPISLLF